ncbi:SAM-dependent methyltransferase [Alicyclobacillus cycloheptanicus]|uniref:tRNA (Adenine22-N1)-methyltransferase n=1 Tax=Alicyclobacillus cycloheptanicus TaxID=1457 RepID=A0ABT9XJH8_9BACL|nr:class I SAM-dependent methyltransferase [Alicyclobacillus cycloheptanicus]MDQ0190462.1 tRNA (adenine22-N1)-methyltransferase [Alicyclobacillus cycloheptanicus]WDM00774.1 SAM-dependent methyltransferase [Alicyclobacillus cycloheptanicus]
MSISLSHRLQAIADVIPPGSVVVDVGTDHALLPIYLIQSGVAARVIATDIADGPADVARRNVEAHGLSERISVRCGDGLATVGPGEAQTIVIAGMGGATIRDILAGTPSVVGAARRIIVQPMNLAQHARAYFFTHGFRLVTECALTDGGKYYEIIAAEPGEPVEYEGYHADRVALEMAWMFGPQLLRSPNASVRAHVADTVQRWGERYERMKASRRPAVTQQAEALLARRAWLEGWLHNVGDPITASREATGGTECGNNHTGCH